MDLSNSLIFLSLQFFHSLIFLCLQLLLGFLLSIKLCLDRFFGFGKLCKDCSQVGIKSILDGFAHVIKVLILLVGKFSSKLLFDFGDLVEDRIDFISLLLDGTLNSVEGSFLVLDFLLDFFDLSLRLSLQFGVVFDFVLKFFLFVLDFLSELTFALDLILNISLDFFNKLSLFFLDGFLD